MADSKIAQSYACGHTKAQAITTQAIAPHLNIHVVMACKNSPFSILCDGGNDRDVRNFFSQLWSGIGMSVNDK